MSEWMQIGNDKQHLADSLWTSRLGIPKRASFTNEAKRDLLSQLNESICSLAIGSLVLCYLTKEN